jgi:DNA-binding MarR family transcriptional regulator
MKDYQELLACNCHLLRGLARTITLLYDARLQQAGIKATQFIVLAAIANAGPLPLTMLAELVDLDRTGLRRNLDVLQRAGWIAIAQGEQDARRRLVAMTDAGRRKLELAIPFWRQAQAEVECRYGAARMRQLRGDLTELAGAVRS